MGRGDEVERSTVSRAAVGNVEGSKEVWSEPGSAGRVTVGRCLRSHGTESRLGIRCTDSDGSVSPRGKYLTARSAPCRAGPRTVTSRRRAREADPPGCTRAKDTISCDGRAARARTPRDSPSGGATPRDAKRIAFLKTRAKQTKSVRRDLPPAIERRGRRANRAGVERTISAAVRDFSIRFESSARVARVASSTRSFSPERVFSRVGTVPLSARIVASGATSGAVDANFRRDVARGSHARRSLRVRPDVRRGVCLGCVCGAASGVAETALRFFMTTTLRRVREAPAHRCLGQSRVPTGAGMKIAGVIGSLFSTWMGFFS